MRYFDAEDAEKINAKPWQLDLLKMNPEYISWGIHEDYMSSGVSWDAPITAASWKDFGPWELNDLNECVNFYFNIIRSSEECDVCNGNGYHPVSQHIVNGFYTHMNDRGDNWCNQITQDEVDVLMASNCLWDFTHGKPEGFVPTAYDVNNSRNPLVHDAINRNILTKTRLNRLGLPVTCPKCDGDCIVYTEENATVSLNLWMLVPRKGCSRGVEVSNIVEDDLPEVFEFLRKAADRNAARFSGIKSRK